MVFAILASLLATFVWLAVPLGLRELLDAVFDEGNREVLNTITVVLIGLFALQSALGFFGNYALDWTGERMVADLRKELFTHLTSLSLAFYTTQRLGELTSRLTNDVAAVRDAVTGTLSEGITQTINLFGSVILMVWLNWRLSLVIFVTVPLITLAVRYFGHVIRQLSKAVQDKLADTTAIAEEALGAIQSVKAFAREPYENDRYSTGVESLFSIARKRVLYSALFWSSVSLMFMSAMIAIFGYGGTEVLAGRLTAGDLVAFIFFAFNIGRSLGGMARIYTVFSSAIGASERIFTLLDEKPGIADLPGARIVLEIKGAVTFNRVSFAYEKQTVLQDINFSCEPGEVIALAGPSGAGKTTLLNLIPRFYDCTTGNILIDGKDVKDFRQIDLRSQIAVVPQDIQLFGTSVIENIRYGRLDATDAEVKEAAKLAYAHDFIMEAEGGYNALIGEKGIKLSGGQKQRLAIARAILRNPKILLLDEATSSLDSESEAAVQKALEYLVRNCTTFVIAHRLSTIKYADRILVLEGGRIAESGSHSELLLQDGLYRRLYDIQFATQ